MSEQRRPSDRRPHLWHSCQRAGFTLVELLVAMTVLTLILVMSAQVFNGAMRTMTQSSRALDVSTEARITLDRIGADIASMVRRGDIDYKFDKKMGNDALAFYAETHGYSTFSLGPPRTLATIDYRIHTGNDPIDMLPNFKLERGSRATAYNEMIFSDPAGAQTYAPGLAPYNTLPLIAATDYTVLANQVFRLEFCYLLKNGKLSKTPNPPTDTAAAGASRPDPGNFKQVAALVVAIGMLDARNRAVLGDLASQPYADKFTALAAALPDVDPDPNNATSASTDILATWQPIVLKMAAGTEQGTSDLPKPVRSNVHVYQRYFLWKQ